MRSLRPSHPVPYVRDDRDTPLLWAGMAGDIEVIWLWREQEYLFKGDWTGGIGLMRFNKSNSASTRIGPAGRANAHPTTAIRDRDLDLAS
jgi:hypothetical protein